MLSHILEDDVTPFIRDASLLERFFYVDMKIFVSLKVPRGDAKLEQLALLIRDIIQRTGHEAFIANDVITRQELTDPKDFMPYVRRHVEDCD